MSTATAIATPSYTPATQAALDALDALETSVASAPDWRHAFDLVDLAKSPLDDLQELLSTAPSTLAATFLTAAIYLRS